MIRAFHELLNVIPWPQKGKTYPEMPENHGQILRKKNYWMNLTQE